MYTPKCLVYMGHLFFLPLSHFNLVDRSGIVKILDLHRANKI